MSTVEKPGVAAVRDEQLARYDVIGDPPGRDLQALVDLLARVCETPGAAINIITSTEQHQIVATGIDPSVCAREDSMCAAFLADPRPVVVADASLDARFATNPFVNGEMGAVRFYASAALLTPDGVPLGRLCVFDVVPRTLTTVQEQALSTLAAQVMDLLELRVRTRSLERSLAELTEARDELGRANHHLTLFAGQVSHDLRSPLTAILANAEMLAMEPAVVADPDLADMVRSVHSAGHRMNGMIEEMLVFARDGGQITLTRTDLQDVFSLVASDLATDIRAKDAEVRVDELPTVMGDSDVLYSVALNLLTNALKFGRPGVRPRVHVSAERRGTHWRISVTDNGIGVAPEQQESMFVLFARGDEQVGGHGIGLATAKRIVAAHGGRVGMETPETGGTTVWFELPA